MRPLVAQTHLDYGRHLVASAQPNGETHIAAAESLFGELGMRAWYESSAQLVEQRTVYIVARSNRELYDFLTQEFTEQRRNTVVLDRRQTSQEAEPGGTERRFNRVDEDLLSWDLALTVSPVLSMRIEPVQTSAAQRA